MATTQPGGVYQNPDGTFVNAHGQPVDSPQTGSEPPGVDSPQTGRADDFARTDEGVGAPQNTGPAEAAKASAPKAAK